MPSIKADTTALEMSLMKAAGSIALRLKEMVKGFSYEFTVSAIENTPLGDARPESEGGNLSRYLQRYRDTGLSPIEGFAQGSWQIDFDPNFMQLDNYSGEIAAKAAKISLMNYNLGNTVYIGNTGPYIRLLENGYSDQAPEGIMKPTLDQILSAYKIDLKRYYSTASV